ncbi:MAG: HNH endonuclease [Cellulosilyticaceae bacterium]
MEKMEDVMGLEKIESYLKKYAGVHYKKPISDEDPMNELALEGKLARETFTQLVKEVEHYFSGYVFLPCNSWLKMNQVASDYFWVQMKKEENIECLSSVSLAIKKIGDKVYFYIAVEIKGDNAKSADISRHNTILDMPLDDDRLYYSEGDELYFNLGQNKLKVKELLQRGEIKKARIQLNIEDAFNNTELAEVVIAVKEGIQTILPYYNKILLNQVSQQQQSWVIICNPKKYDVIRAFHELDTIEWKQSTNILVGDIVYIYISNHYKEIKYKCQVSKVNLTETTIDDSKFIIEGSSYVNHGRYMELQLVTIYKDGILPYERLKEHGLKAVQGPSKVNARLDRYLNTQEIVANQDVWKKEIVEDSLLTKEILIEASENQTSTTSYKRKEAIIRDGIKVYPRDKIVAARALKKANYLCELDNIHDTFMRRNTEIPYTEPHHLIPLAFSEMFEISLDIEENIVSLCSTCHNQLHYGEGARTLLRRLYNERIECLNNIGIVICIDELLCMYGL